jgi:hypothetical protein
MNRLNARFWSGCAASLLAVVVAVTVMGAATGPASYTPRYSVQTFVVGGAQVFYAVTDNQDNTLYTYQFGEGKEPDLKLAFSVNLSQAGKAVMKAEKPPKDEAKAETR